MTRPKASSREAALSTAIEVFADRGFEGASTKTLVQATGVHRQRLYDTFGSKRELYLEALRRHNSESVALILRDIERGATPLKAIRNALLQIAKRAGHRTKRPA
jgi:TetR/AcrR family transcriptional repressor of nem operon